MDHHITITLNTDNAAFDNVGEIPRILERAVAEIKEELALSEGLNDTAHGTFPLKDLNGNKVGSVAILSEN